MSESGMHAKPRVSGAILRTVMRPVLGDIEIVRHNDDGLESAVWIVRLAGEVGQRVIRINASDRGFRNDAWVHQQFPGLPTPRVTHLGQVGQLFYSVSDYVEGVAGDDQVVDIQACGQAAAKTLRDIHTVPVTNPGYGGIDSQGCGTSTTWREFLEVIPNHLQHKAVKSTSDRKVLHTVLDVYGQLVPFCPEERQLVHGDYMGRNVLFQGDQVAAVLDWADALYGDALYDIAAINFLPEQVGVWCTQQYLAGRAPSNNVDQRMLCYKLHIGLKNFLYALETGRLHWGSIALQRCSRLIDEYNDH